MRLADATPQTILIVEDDRDLAELLSCNLQEAGFRTITVSDGQKALKTVHRTRPDLVLLDVMLPGMDGTDICRAIRTHARLKETPVIFLTARHEEGDRVMGLELGADDYVVKPFSVRELLLRIQAVLRRAPVVPSPSGKVMTFGPVTIVTDRCEVSLHGVPVSLTAIEYKLLLALAEQAGSVQSRQVLLKQVWGVNHHVELRTIDTHITRLRVKIGELGGMIKAVRGFGYVLEP